MLFFLQALLALIALGAEMTPPSSVGKKQDLRQVLVKKQDERLWTPVVILVSDKDPPFLSPVKLVTERKFDVILLYRPIDIYRLPLRGEGGILHAEKPMSIQKAMVAGFSLMLERTLSSSHIGVMITQEHDHFTVTLLREQPNDQTSLFPVWRAAKDTTIRIELVILGPFSKVKIAGARSPRELSNAFECLPDSFDLRSLVLIRYGIEINRPAYMTRRPVKTSRLIRGLYRHAFHLFRDFPDLMSISLQDSESFGFFMSKIPGRDFKKRLDELLLGKSPWEWSTKMPPPIPLEVDAQWRFDGLPNLAPNIIASSASTIGYITSAFPIILAPFFGISRSISSAGDAKYRLPVKAELAIEVLKKMAGKLIDERDWPSIVRVHIEPRISLAECLNNGGWVNLRVVEKGVGVCRERVEAWLLEFQQNPSQESGYDIDKALEEVEQSLQQYTISDPPEVTQILVRPSRPLSDPSPWTFINNTNQTPLGWLYFPAYAAEMLGFDVVHFFSSPLEHRRPMVKGKKYAARLATVCPADKIDEGIAAFIHTTDNGALVQYQPKAKAFAIYRLLEVQDDSQDGIEFKRRPMNNPLRMVVRMLVPGKEAKKLRIMRLTASHFADFDL